MGVYLSYPMKGKKSISSSNNILSFAICEMQGWRTTMEDAHIAQLNLPNDVQLFGVFDGHGGSEVSIFVERHFVQELVRNKNYNNLKFEQALTETFHQMDNLLLSEIGQREIKELAINPNEQSQAGCTALVLLIHNNILYIANAGDSRVIICENNSFKQLTQDHKPELPNEMKRIVNAGGTIQEGRINGMLNLSRAIGDFEFKKEQKLKSEEQMVISTPDITQYKLDSSHSYILMGCDGVWETMDYTKMEQFLTPRIQLAQNNPKELESILEDLLENLIAHDTIQGTGCDNMSIVLISLIKTIQ